VQVIGIKNKRFVLREKDASKWLSCVTVAADVIYLCEVEIPSLHQLTNVTVGSREVLLFVTLVTPPYLW